MRGAMLLAAAQRKLITLETPGSCMVTP